MKSIKFLLILLPIFWQSFSQSISLDPRSVLLPQYTDLAAIEAAIPTATVGMMVYNMATGSNWYFNGSVWVNMLGSGAGGTLTLPFAQTATNSSPLFAITNSGSGAAAAFTGTKALETSGSIKIGGTGVGTPAVGKQLTAVDAQGTAQWKDLVPRLSTEEIDLLPSPQLGDLAYDLTFRCLKQYNGSKWLCTYQSAENPTATMTAKRDGGPGFDFGTKITTDAGGFTYIGGGFNGSFTIGVGSSNATNLSSNNPATSYYHDALIAKYNAAGQLVWAKQTQASTDAYAYVNDIAVDASGNIYVAGYFNGTVLWGQGSTNAQTLTVSKQEMFLAKYDINGDLLWIRQTTSSGTIGYNDATALVLDSNGDIYVTGTFFNFTSFGAVSHASTGYGDIYIAKYLANGTVAFVQKAGGTNGEASLDIAIDTSNMLYITGSFNSATCYFTGFSVTNAYNFSDVFIAKMTPAGVWTWAVKAGGVGADKGNSLKINSLGKLFVGGHFESVANFGSNYLEAGQNGNLFLSRLNTDTGAFDWSFKINGQNQKFISDIATDAFGNFYVSGEFSGEVSISPYTIYYPSYGNSNSMFVAKFSTNGYCNWVKTCDTESNGSGVAISNSGNIYATGYFKGTGVFGPTTLTAAGGYDLYLARLKE